MEGELKPMLSLPPPKVKLKVYVKSSVTYRAANKALALNDRPPVTPQQSWDQIQQEHICHFQVCDSSCNKLLGFIYLFIFFFENHQWKCLIAISSQKIRNIND